MCALTIALSAAVGCGGAASGPQQASQTGNSLPSGDVAASNAPSLVVPMSMVIPKKAPPPPQMTAPTAPQIPPGGGFPGAGAATPGAGVPGGAAPTDPSAGAMVPGAGVPGAAGAAGAAAPATPPAGMMTAAAGGAAPAAPGTAAGADIAGVPEAELSMLRDLCVSEINMYRATLPDRMLSVLKRATPEQEECSQRGAKMDGDTMSAHGAAKAGLCSSVGLSSEDTCPGWPVGGNTAFGGYATIADALKGCLKSMWEEGEPPVSREECQKDYQGCFLKHGHYLNMSDANIASVACSFYKMMDGKSYWMNQDFTSNWSGWGRK